MTAFVLRSTTVQRRQDFLLRLLATLTIWRERSIQRAELARWSDMALHDIGQSRSSIACEIAKPFWRE
jgi:uncharacterized protein YjiS (DUF1127 family)